jgi:hypothetical protein
MTMTEHATTVADKEQEIASARRVLQQLRISSTDVMGQSLTQAQNIVDTLAEELEALRLKATIGTYHAHITAAEQYQKKADQLSKECGLARQAAMDRMYLGIGPPQESDHALGDAYARSESEMDKLQDRATFIQAELNRFLDLARRSRMAARVWLQENLELVHLIPSPIEESQRWGEVMYSSSERYSSELRAQIDRLHG